MSRPVYPVTLHLTDEERQVLEALREKGGYRHLVATLRARIPKLSKVDSQISETVVLRMITQLCGWLTAVGIPHQPGNGHDTLTVKAADGRSIEVIISEGCPMSGPRTLVVDASQMAGRNQTRESLAMFQRLQRRLGYSPRKPVERGALPQSMTRDFDLNAMRHMELRRVPNPSPAELRHYQPIVRRACAKFFYRNRVSCITHMLEIDDLETYAQIWTTNFIGLYRRADAVDGENERLLTCYLRQGFIAFSEILKRRARDTVLRNDTGTDVLESSPWAIATLDGSKDDNVFTKRPSQRSQGG